MLDKKDDRKRKVFKNCKTYLRNSIGQNRLNHLMLMNNHQEKAEKSLTKIANSFVWESLYEKRKTDFEKI